MTNKVTEKQNNYILELVRINPECRIYFEEYMEKTDKEPEKRDFRKLLDNLVKLEEKQRKYSIRILDKNIEKLEELRDMTPQFKEDIQEYKIKRGINNIKELTEFDAMQLKLAYIEKYIRGRK